MQVRYQCNANDYVEAVRAVLWRSFGFYFLVIGGFVLMVFGIVRFYDGDRIAGEKAIAIAALWIGWAAIFRPLWARRDFRKHPNLALERSLLITTEGMSTQTATSRGEYKWSVFTRLRETTNLFMLYTGARTFIIIPKRAFSGAQLQEFRALLAQNLAAR